MVLDKVAQIQASLGTPTKDKHDRGLPRVLGLGEVVSFGFGNCLGAGIYVTVGAAMVNCAGPSVFLSFLLGGFSSLMTAMCYAELASQPELAHTTGSAYTYTVATLGPIVGLLCGWYLSIGYLLGAAAVARGWAHYMQVLLGSWAVPGSQLGTLLFEQHVVPGPWPPGLLSVEAAAPMLCLLLTTVVLSGTKTSARFNMALTLVNLLVIIVFVMSGLYYFDSANFTPFTKAPQGDGGLAGIVAGAGLVYFAFLGYDAVTAFAGEARDPSRTIPRAVILTVLGVTAIYTSCAVALAGMVLADSVSTEAPLANALVAKGCHNLATLIGCGAILTSAANTFCALLGQPRIWFAMARDGLLPPWLMGVNPITQVPEVATMLAGLVCIVLSAALRVEMLIKVTSASSLVVFNFVAIGLCKRRTEQAYAHGGIGPFINVISVALLLFLCGCLMLGVSLQNGLHSLPTYVAMLVCFLAGITVCVLWPWGMSPQDRCAHQVVVVPGGPLVPLVAVLVNSVLLGSLGTDTLKQLIFWTLPVLIFCLLSFFRAVNPERFPLLAKHSRVLC